MTLYPQLDSYYYLDGDRNIKQQMDYRYAQAIQINQSFWSEADIDMRFVAGDQTLWNDIYGNLPAFRRRQFNFNRIRTIVNMITGFQRQHRKSTIVLPVENSDQQTADQFSKILIWANNNGNILDTISEAFEGACKTGMNLLSVWMDYRYDPVSGDIRVDNKAYNSYLIDPYFRKKDLSDCNFVWVRNWLSKTQIKSLLPDRAKDIDALQARGNRDGKFQFQPEAYNYGMQDLLSYDEYWYADNREQTMLIDTQTGETMEWKGNNEQLQQFKKAYPEVISVNQVIPTVKLAINVQGEIMYHGPNPLNIDRYPFIPVWGYYEPDIPYFPWRVQGVVRGLRDAQFLYNRRKVIELDILESQINSGFKYKENALVNPKDVFLSGQGKGLALKATAEMSDVEPIMPPQVPPSMLELSKILSDEIMKISGVNEELLGAAVDDKAGILSMLRQGAGLTTLQILFDQLDFAQKNLGKLMVDLIQNNFTPGKVQRIVGAKPTEQFYNRAFQKYDCAVEEGLNTSTQKQMQFAQLLQLRELNIPVPASVLIDNSTLQNKQELIDAIKQEEQSQSQNAQMQAQAQMQQQQAVAESFKAKSFADMALGQERLAKIEDNRAMAIEHVAEAQKDRAMAVYNELKAAKELQGLDLNNLKQLIDIIQVIQNENKVEEKAEKSSEVTRGSQQLNKQGGNL